ncbi:MAG: nucleotidyltransferase family protein [Myxococcota bacterium]
MLTKVDLILACARTRLGERQRERIASLAAAESDWPGVVRVARDHGVAPLVHRALERVCPDALPCRARAELRACRRASQYRGAAMIRQLLRTISMLEENAIPALPFKGPTLAVGAYGDVALRQPSDLDILVREHAFPASLDLLLRNGYRKAVAEDGSASGYARDNDHAVLLIPPEGSVAIDLHRRLMPSAFIGDLDVERTWRRHEWLDLCGSKVRCLRAADELVYLCVHGSKSWWHRLSWVCDVAETLEFNRSLDWEDVTSLASSARASRMLWLGVLLAHEMLSAPVPDDVLSRAREDVSIRELATRVRDELLAGAWTRHDDIARFRFHQVLAEGPREQVRYLFHIARRYAQPNELDRAAVALPRVLHPLYYGVRALRLTGRYASRLVRPRQSRASRN